MELGKSIEQMVTEYKESLTTEFEAKLAVEARIATAYTSGEIDGKNAETRKAQEVALTTELARAAGLAEASRKAIEAEIGLVKAMLYSQSGRS